MEPVVFDDVDAAQPAQRDGSRVDLRVATIGNVDSGKSTLVGVLTRGQLDDGNGLARKCVFTHAHEIASGRSSTVSTELMVSGRPAVLCCERGGAGRVFCSALGAWACSSAPRARSGAGAHVLLLGVSRLTHAPTHLQGFLSDKPYHVDVRATRQKRWQEIRAHSERSVTFVDLCGA